MPIRAAVWVEFSGQGGLEDLFGDFEASPRSVFHARRFE